MKSKTAVVILNWNGKKDTVPCLESLEKIPNRCVIVVDNGSTDGSVPVIREKFPWAAVIETGKNLGYAAGNNVGIEHALKNGADAVFLLNNDTIVDPGILDALDQAAEQHPKIGIFGAWPLRFYAPDKLDHLGGRWNSRKGEFDLVGLEAPADFKFDGELDYVCGCSMWVRREVFEKNGLLEPSFFLFWEEADFCMRAKKNGFKIGVCPEAKLQHKVSASFTGGKPHVAYFWWRNRFLWIERNLDPKERRQVFFKILLPQLAHLYKLRILKGLELRFLKLMHKNQDLKVKEQKVTQYRASLLGFHDYIRRRFGNAPASIFKIVS
jgi:hypothetical protein